MPLPTPNLDNISFKDLVDEAKALIPVYAPGWTNYNPSDPGIILIELFAWLCEMIMFRINRVPEKNYLRLLELIGCQLNEGESIEAAIHRGVKQLYTPYRAVTAMDYEVMALQGMQEKHPGLAGRILCFAKQDLENNPDLENLEGHISVVIILRPEDAVSPEKYMEICRNVKQYLDPRRLLTTRVHVLPPICRDIEIDVWIALKERIGTRKVTDRIWEYLHPVTGGPGGCGWPVGRAVYPSDIFHLLEYMPEVDHVERIDLRCINPDGSKATDAFSLAPHELIRVRDREKDMRVEVV